MFFHFRLFVIFEFLAVKIRFCSQHDSPDLQAAWEKHLTYLLQTHH